MRLSEASATWRMRSGRLLSPPTAGASVEVEIEAELWSAMTALSRTDGSALPSEGLVGAGAVDFKGGVKEKVIPRSTVAWRRETASFSSGWGR